MLRQTSLALLLSLCSAVGGYSTELPSDLRLGHLGINDGLSSSAVSSIVQDESGFIWFGTQSGVNRYNGYDVERFEHDPFDPNSLSHNLVQTMFYEGPDVLWIGTYGGLNRLDMGRNRFTVLQNDPSDAKSLSNNVIVAIERDAAGSLWVGTLDGLNRLESSGETFTRYLAREQADDGSAASEGSADERGALPSSVVRALHRDSLGRLWVGTYGGLSRYLPGEDAFVTVTTSGEPDYVLPSPYVMSIVEDPQEPDVLWIGTWDGGVSRYETTTGRIRTITLPHDEIYTMMFDSHGRLWVGTWGGGLLIVDPETGAYESLQAENAAGADLAHDVVYSLLEDESGIVWIGTNGGGVNKYVPWENRFETYAHRSGDDDSLAAGRVEAIEIDSDGTIWVGVYDGGLNRLLPDGDGFVHYRHDPENPNSLSNDIVNAVLRDSRGRLWVGTNRGLNRYLEESDRFERIFGGEPRDLPDYVVFEISESPTGELWLGTNTSGLVIYDPDTGATRSYAHDPDDPTSLSDNLVRAIAWDREGSAWIGTNHGLNRFDEQTGTFERFLHDSSNRSTISSDNIRAIRTDHEGRLWIATTGGGLNRFDHETGRFTLISTDDGLASHHVVGIVVDGDGDLWLPTNRGISVYDTADGTFRTWNAATGLLSNELTQGVARDAQGRLYFGSVDGFTVVNPLEREIPHFVPPVLLTRFEVLGRERSLSKAEDGTYETIVLDHDHSFFSFEFAALDYASPAHNRYAYKLEGFDGEWNQVGNRTFASYTNLRHGRYTLRIRGAGSRGNWNDDGIAVPIVVRPPWWRSQAAWTAYTLIGLALLAGAVLSVRTMQRRSRRRIAEQERINEELETKVQHRTREIDAARRLAEQATREKSRFLANMSHEIRTPLNGMLGMMSLLEKTDLEPRQREYLSHSRTSAENLNTLVNDLLDFERIEAGKLRLVSEPFSIPDAAHYIDHLFRPTAQEQGLGFTVEVDLCGASTNVMGDESRFVQVLTNLVSNGLKYTRSGEVRLRITAGDTSRVADAQPASTEGRQRTYRIEVVDTGIGIGREQQEAIFEHFRQLDSGYSKSARGVGLGLAIVKQVVEAQGGTISVESTPGEGSRFVVDIAYREASDAETSRTTEGNQQPGGSATGTPPGENAPSTDPHPQQTRVGTDVRPAVLVCEDEAINQLYLQHHLGALGYEVDVAPDGETAVQKAVATHFALILMDLGMPRMNGLEAAKAIRSAESAAGEEPVPIVALTAHTYEDDIEQCYAAGMTGFLSKPVQETELERVLRDRIR